MRWGWVELVARRVGCPGGTAFAVMAAKQDLRPGRPRAFLIPAEAITPASIGRAYQPWHADVEPDKHQRWKAYQGPESLTLAQPARRRHPGALRTREDDRVTAQLIALTEQPVAARFGSSKAAEVTGRI